MSQTLSSSDHARGKGLPATVGHMSPRDQSERSEEFWKMGVPERFREALRHRWQSNKLARTRIFHVAAVKQLHYLRDNASIIETAGWEKPRYAQRSKSKCSINHQFIQDNIYLSQLYSNTSASSGLKAQTPPLNVNRNCTSFTFSTWKPNQVLLNKLIYYSVENFKNCQGNLTPEEEFVY